MRGHVHSYCHGHGSAHTDAVGRNNGIGQHHRGGVIIHQVLTVYGGLVDIRSGTAHIVTIRATSRILRRLKPAVLGALRGGRCDHEGTAGTDVLRSGTHLNVQVVGQAHGELGRLGTAVGIRHGHHIDSGIQAGRIVRVKVVHIRQIHIGIMGGGRILVSVTVGVRLKTVGSGHRGTAGLVVAVGIAAGSRNGEILHNDGAREGLVAARRGLVARGCDGEVVGARSGRGTRDAVAGKRHTRSCRSIKGNSGILSCDIDGRDARAETNLLREVVGGELHGVVHHHRNAGSAGTTVHILDIHRVSVVTSGRRGGCYGGDVGGVQRGTRGPIVRHDTRGIGRGGRQRGGTAKTDGGRIGIDAHTQFGRDDDVHRRGLSVVAVVLHRYGDFDSLLESGLRILGAGSNALAHESGCAAFNGSSVEGEGREVGHLIRTVKDSRGIGVRQAGNHWIGWHLHRHNVVGGCLATVVVCHGHRHGVVLSAGTGRVGNLYCGRIAQLVGRLGGRGNGQITAPSIREVCCMRAGHNSCYVGGFNIRADLYVSEFHYGIRDHRQLSRHNAVASDHRDQSVRKGPGSLKGYMIPSIGQLDIANGSAQCVSLGFVFGQCYASCADTHSVRRCDRH